MLVDDPAADLHEEAGRFFYFAPDELEPLDQAPRGESPMRTVGLLTTIVGAGIAAVAAIVGVRSIPDVKRYLKMRQM